MSSECAGHLGHGHFGTCHFGTYSIQYIVTSGHVISGQVQFGTAQLHYFKCTDSSHGKSVQVLIYAIIRY